MPSFKDRSV